MSGLGGPPGEGDLASGARRIEARGLPTNVFAGLSFHCGVPVPMRDGTLLSADVYRPDGDGPFPVLLMRQPYGRDVASTVVYAHPTWFARHGFIVVIQDVRGRGGSEGEFYPFRDDVQDGYDAVAWAASLPGSNGRVGMYGFSYQGLTQVAAAVSRPPALKAIAPHMTAFDPYSAWFYRDGILKLSFALRWGNQILREDARRAGASVAASALDAAWLSPARRMHAFPLAWFHHWLDREVPPGAPPFAGCRYFVLGENAWRKAPAWPPGPASAEEWFLQSGGRAHSRFGDGRLGRSGPEGTDDLFNYDPEVPVEAPGGDRAGLVAFGPHDLAEQQQRLDLLVYTSAPLDASLLVAGRPECVVHLLSSAPSTDLVARLSRVTPDGRAQFISLGAIRCDFDASAARPVERRIRLDPTAVRFAVGERIRLDLAGSAFPLLVRNPNTGADPVEVRTPGEFRRARQVIYHDASRPSRLILPALAA